MKNLTKSLIGAGVAAAALVAPMAPAQARHDDRDGISAGEVIAGAVILGGLVAVLASSDNDRDRDYRYSNDRYGNDRYENRNDNRGYGYDYNRYGNSRQAVSQCVNTVERTGNRYSRANVTEIQDIERTRNGYRVKGKVVVQDGNRNYRGGYDRGYNRDYDQGRFTCYVERGRVVDIDYKGINQWR